MKVADPAAVVLVVEDDPDVRDMIVGVLEADGYAVLEAEDGPKALEMLRHRDAVSLLSTDMRLPGLGGTALAEKAVAIKPGLKILLTSGYLDGGSAVFLRKPYTIERLREEVRSALGATLRAAT